MHKPISLFLISFILMTTHLKAQDLEDFRWKNRIIIVYEDKTDHQKFERQINLLNSEKAGLQERRILLFQISGGKIKDQNNHIYGNSLHEDISKMQSKLDTFEVLLIGLDGGVKLRESNSVSLKNLYSLIDGMPMRQAEIRRKKN